MGFAGCDDDPDTLFTQTVRLFPQSEVFGVDINAKKIKKLARPNTKVADGKHLPFKTNTFECVVLAEVLEHQTAPFEFITEAYRVLKDDGIFLITTPNPLGVFRWLKHYIFARDIGNKGNVLTYMGSSDHKMFIEPLSLISLLYLAKFRKVIVTTKNPSYPYFPKKLRELEIPFWPFTRLGTYSCLKAVK